jgi:hypothetical protein
MRAIFNNMVGELDIYTNEVVFEGKRFKCIFDAIDYFEKLRKEEDIFFHFLLKEF